MGREGIINIGFFVEDGFEIGNNPIVLTWAFVPMPGSKEEQAFVGSIAIEASPAKKGSGCNRFFRTENLSNSYAGSPMLFLLTHLRELNKNQWRYPRSSIVNKTTRTLFVKVEPVSRIPAAKAAITTG